MKPSSGTTGEAVVVPSLSVGGSACEGGNLGMTQRGRIEAALNGVLLNTDFIDNSAGVDTSDHEVNIKTLLNEIVARGQLTSARLRRHPDEGDDDDRHGGNHESTHGTSSGCGTWGPREGRAFRQRTFHTFAPSHLTAIC